MLSHTVLRVTTGVVTASLWLISSAGVVPAQRTARPGAKPSIVDVKIHADLKETYDLERQTPTERSTAHADFTVSQDYSRRMEWVGYQNAPGGLLPIDNSPGLSSGSFHYHSEDELKGDKLGDKHVIDTAGSIDPKSSTADVQLGEGDSEIIADLSSEATKATCATSGNMNEDPHFCGQVYVLDELRVDHEEGKPDATSQLAFGYELHPISDIPQGYKGAGQFGEKQWYGSVTSGSNGKFEITFDGKKAFDRPSDDQYTKTDHHEQHLRVTATVSPAGGTAQNLPTIFHPWTARDAAAVLASKFALS